MQDNETILQVHVGSASKFKDQQGRMQVYSLRDYCITAIIGLDKFTIGNINQLLLERRKLRFQEFTMSKIQSGYFRIY